MPVLQFPKAPPSSLRKPRSPGDMAAYDCSRCDYGIFVCELALNRAASLSNTPDSSFAGLL
jgi:hypothetical protein